MNTAMPFRPRLALFLVAALPLALLASSGDAAAQDGKLADVLKPFVDRHTLAGAVVLVADKDKILDLEAVGFADIENSTLMGTDSLFWIASMSKPITALALMLLVDEGKVNLDDPVEKYLPEFKDIVMKGGDNQKPKHAITVREILSHTSGLPFSTPQEQPTLDKLTLKEGTASYVKTGLNSEPGTKYAYSNAGINTAGRIIEVVSGMPYEDFLQKRLFDPLGMKDTTFWPSEAQLKRLAKPYRPGKDKKGLEATKIGQLQYPLSDRKRQPMPAGGLFSTAKDVARLCQMVLNGGTFEGKRYLSEAAVKEMTSRQTGKDIPTSYGLGWSVGAGSFGHGGALATSMTIDTKRGLVLVWMVQHAGFPGDGGQSQGAFRKAAEARFGKK
jgi:CubicO group peptidase (beta-lactamase class C family)